MFRDALASVPAALIVAACRPFAPCVSRSRDKDSDTGAIEAAVSSEVGSKMQMLEREIARYESEAAKASEARQQHEALLEEVKSEVTPAYFASELSRPAVAGDNRDAVPWFPLCPPLSRLRRRRSLQRGERSP